MAINKRETKREVKKLLKSGMSKEDIYYELIDKYKNPIETRGIAYTKRIHRDIANVIRYIPSNERLKKYGVFNTLLLIPMLLWASWYLLQGDFSRLFWPGIFSFILGYKHTKYYFVFAATGILLICQGLAMSLYAYQDYFLGLSMTLVLVLCILLGTALIVFGIYMPRLLTPKYTFTDEIITTSDGKKKKKISFG